MPKFDLSTLGPLKQGWLMPAWVGGREVRFWVHPGAASSFPRWVADEDTSPAIRDAHESLVRRLIWELLLNRFGEEDLLPYEMCTGE